MTSHELDQEVRSIMRIGERIVAYFFGVGLVATLIWLAYIFLLLWGMWRQI